MVKVVISQVERDLVVVPVMSQVERALVVVKVVISQVKRVLVVVAVVGLMARDTVAEPVMRQVAMVEMLARVPYNAKQTNHLPKVNFLHNTLCCLIPRCTPICTKTDIPPLSFPLNTY